MKENMDDGEIEVSDHVLLPNSDSSSNFQPSLSSDSFLDDLLRSAQTCTHTHTCNPPGPDTTHTHTCYHTHTHLIPPPDGEQSPILKAGRPPGNREAVRKYREKKKAQAAYLEEEVKKLRLVNQVLVRKLQKQTVLEAEVVRLRGLLLDLRGKIDSELGDFPFKKQCSSVDSFTGGECGVQPGDGSDIGCGFGGSSVPSSVRGRCGKPGTAWDGSCQPAGVGCDANTNYVGSGKKRSLDKIASSSPREGKKRQVDYHNAL